MKSLGLIPSTLSGRVMLFLNGIGLPQSSSFAEVAAIAAAAGATYFLGGGLLSDG